MVIEFTPEQSKEIEKIQWLLTYQRELNLDKTDIDLLKEKRNEFVEIIRSKYFQITDGEINEAFKRCTPTNDMFSVSLEYYLFCQHSEIDAIITINSDDPNQPVHKSEKDYDDRSVYEQIIKFDDNYLTYYRTFSR